MRLLLELSVEGIRWMHQVVYKILQDKEDTTDVSMIFANTSENDIILKDVIDDLAKNHDNFHVW